MAEGGVGEHVFRVRVYYEDTDAGGVVYYANYLRYSERARGEFLRDLGIEQSRLRAEHSLMFVVRRCEVDYLRPCRLDDVIEVRTRLKELGGASLEIEHRFLRDGDEVVRMAVRVVCVDMKAGGRPHRLPNEIRASLAGTLN
jgi:acyl-CoA thioester hydrolase